MANASHQLRSLAHRLLNDSECAELKSAIQGFKKDQSVLMLCASLYKILSTPEKMQILLAVYPMIPQEMQADFDSLCTLQFDYYATTLRSKISEKYDKKSKKGGHGRHKAKESARSAAIVSIEQLRRFHSPRDNSGAGDEGKEWVQAARSSGKDEPAPSRSRRSREHRHRRSPDQSRRNAHIVHQRHRKRSKTAHAVLGPPKIDSPRHVGHSKGPEPPRVPPLDLDTSHNSSNTSMNSTSQHSSSRQHTPKNIPIRKIKLERRAGESLGFAIRGGTDLKSGIYVSEIDPGGQAERRGLRVGERILKVNDVTFKNVSHAEAVAALKASRRLTIYVAPIGLMPGSTPIITPRDVHSGRSEDSGRMSAKSPRMANSEVKKITVVADEDNWLGCSIRGGVDCGIDVMVANVDPDSPAYKAGLKKGQCIIKVNDAAVDTLTHTQVISLITASNVVVFEVKPGSKEKLQSFRKQKVPTADSSQPSSTLTNGSPRQQSSEQMNAMDFEKELMSTPPVSTSTPLPPDDHPLLLPNRLEYNSSKSEVDDATIIQLLQNGGVSLSQDGADSSNVPHDQNNLVQKEQYAKHRESKFDKGTIKLNMAEKDQKAMLKTAKIIDINIAPISKTDKRRSHVKDIFADNLKTPATAKSSRSESCRSPTRPNKTPQRDRANSMNILSTPYSKKKMQQIPVTPPRTQLQDASTTAKMQLKQELTGKRLLVSPNVPVAPDSPVANFFRKVLHTENYEHKNLRKIGSLESFGTHRGLDGKQSNMSAGMTKWRSAYDFVTETESDSDSN